MDKNTNLKAALHGQLLNYIHSHYNTHYNKLE